MNDSELPDIRQELRGVFVDPSWIDDAPVLSKFDLNEIQHCKPGGQNSPGDISPNDLVGFNRIYSKALEYAYPQFCNAYTDYYVSRNQFLKDFWLKADQLPLLEKQTYLNQAKELWGANAHLEKTLEKRFMVIDLTWLSCGQNLAAEIEHFAKEVRKFDMTHIDNIEGRNAMDPPEDGCSPIFRQKFNLFMKDFYYFANGQIPVSGDQCKVQEKCLDYYSSQYPDSFDSCKFGTESATEIVNYMSHGCDLRGDSHQPGVTYFCPTKYTH